MAVKLYRCIFCVVKKLNFLSWAIRPVFCWSTHIYLNISILKHINITIIAAISLISHIFTQLNKIKGDSWLDCIVGTMVGHLIVLVRHKQAKMCFQDDPECYLILANFLMLHSLTAWCVQSSVAELATATVLLFWWKFLEFRGEKTFHGIECLHVCTILLQF